ncbi:hypothetical protein RIF29_20246 [Crotalaria pallida]|uniref:Uncharacterized protein n=1 Tax=Crotalaria pallida TaxID=3830 RepID=A0AAN9F0W1_CROPI
METVSFPIKVCLAPEEAKAVVEMYEITSMTNEISNGDPETVLMHRILETKEELNKLRKKNHEIEMTLAMFEYMKTGKMPTTLSRAYLKDLDQLIEQNMMKIENKMATLG